MKATGNLFTRRQLIGLGAVAAGSIALGSLSGCGSSAPSASTTTESPGSKDLFPVRMVSLSNFNELYIGKALGFYADAGIDLQQVGVLPTGVTEFQLLEQGELDLFCNTHPPSIAQARIAGIRARSVQPSTIDTRKWPHVTYLVQEDSELKTLDDLRYHKVGIGGIAACTNGFIDFYLGQKFSDYDPFDVEYVELGTSLEPSLLAGQIDAATSHAPLAGITLAAGGVRAIGTSSDILNQEGFSLAVRGFLDSFIEEHPDIVQAYANASYRSRSWIDSHPNEAVEIIGAILELEPDHISIAAQELSKIHVVKDLERWFTIGEAVGNWEPGQAKVDDIYTNDFVPEDPPASDANLRWDGTLPTF